MGFFDIYSVIFLVIAVVIFWKLRSVLGTKTGSERPPADRFMSRQARPDKTGSDNKVIPLQPIAPPAVDAVPVVGQPSSALDDALRMIARADRDFDQAHFLGGARAAYEMIVTAFAQGDRQTLQPLLSNAVFDNFSMALDERERLGHVVETRFVGIERAEIVEAHLVNGVADVTVRFVSHLITATLDRAGTVVDGDANRVIDVIDVWRFAREVTSPDPNWRLVATDNG